jgi:hypothetical protein
VIAKHSLGKESQLDQQNYFELLMDSANVSSEGDCFAENRLAKT